MAFTIAGAAIDPHNGLNTDGLTCDAFNEEAWFPSSSPVANTALPGSPDATDTSGPTGNSGQTGHYLMTVPKSGSYWVATFNAFDPTVIAWVKVLTHPHTPLAGWTAAVDQTASRSFASTTIAAGSNNVALPATPISVASTTGFTSSGYIMIHITGSSVSTIVHYTGTSGGNSFTGCTLGAGTMLTGHAVHQAYLNGANRRLSIVSSGAAAIAAGDTAAVLGYATLGGSIVGVTGEIGMGAFNNTAGEVLIATQATLPVDPAGYYGFFKSTAGSGAITLNSWIEVDF